LFLQHVQAVNLVDQIQLVGSFPAKIDATTTGTLHGTPWCYIESKLEELKLATELLDRLPSAVSGGELQRISIIRALTVRPKILLADEPTNRLDPITQRETMDLLAEISEREKVAVVLVTHDKDMAEKWADKTLDISTGP